MTEQPESLRLAKLIESNWSRDLGHEAAAELRRLHEEVQEQCRINGMGAERELRLMAVNQELLGALQLMNVDCQYLHHAKSACHSLSEPCPVEQRIRAAIARAEGETK